MRRAFLITVIAAMASLPAVQGQSFSACDLNQDGKTDSTDVQLAINMSLGLAPCTANVAGSGVCNVVATQRVTNAALGGTCITSASHSVTLNWGSSACSNLAGYNVYRGTASGGPYTRLNSSPVTATSFADTGVQGGQTYFYVATAVDTTNLESTYSNEARAPVPTP